MSRTDRTGRKSAELCDSGSHVTDFWSVLGLYLTPVSLRLSRSLALAAAVLTVELISLVIYIFISKPGSRLQEVLGLNSEVTKLNRHIFLSEEKKKSHGEV